MGETDMAQTNSRVSTYLCRQPSPAARKRESESKFSSAPFD